jgi:hypothetical protein
MPMMATSVAQTSDITTILRWVVRSAVNIEELFIASSRKGISLVSRPRPPEGSLNQSADDAKLIAPPLRAPLTAPPMSLTLLM